MMNKFEERRRSEWDRDAGYDSGRRYDRPGYDDGGSSPEYRQRRDSRSDWDYNDSDPRRFDRGSDVSRGSDGGERYEGRPGYREQSRSRQDYGEFDRGDPGNWNNPQEHYSGRRGGPGQGQYDRREQDYSRSRPGGDDYSYAREGNYFPYNRDNRRSGSRYSEDDLNRGDYGYREYQEPRRHDAGRSHGDVERGDRWEESDQGNYRYDYGGGRQMARGESGERDSQGRYDYGHYSEGRQNDGGRYNYGREESRDRYERDQRRRRRDDNRRREQYRGQHEHRDWDASPDVDRYTHPERYGYGNTEVGEQDRYHPSGGAGSAAGRRGSERGRYESEDYRSADQMGGDYESHHRNQGIGYGRGSSRGGRNDHLWNSTDDRH